MAKIRPLSDELQKSAIEQINEVPERIPDDLEALRTWIKQQPYLRSRTDDQFLLSFLRGCKFSLEKAKSKIDKYYTLRTKYPQFFICTDVDNPRFREIWNLGIFVCLPTPLNENGPKLAIMRNGIYSPDKYNISEVMHVISVVQDILLIEDDCALINGVIGVMDCSDVTAAHMFQMSPSLMKKMTTYSEEAMPFRPKAQHFINTPAGFDTIFNIFKPMLSKKQQGRLFMHGSNMEALHKQIPKKYLPIEYGGENGSIKDLIEYWNKKLDEYREYFKEEANYGTDEHLRPGKPIDFDELYGMEGSFRKLNVD